ncbi:MAG: hypothetical protein JNM10_09285 [Planctomycetia bacterium]|nr:hypothetical protein [Planctomycetia bacterium]
MNPFEVLGLTEGPFTRAAVRRAYAAALRRHPPETDPAGFRSVRDAYEALSRLDDAALARWAATALGSSPDDDEPPDDESDGDAFADDALDDDDRAAPPLEPPPGRPAGAAAAPLSAFEADLRARLREPPAGDAGAARAAEVLASVMPGAAADIGVARIVVVVAREERGDAIDLLARAATPGFARTLLLDGDAEVVGVVVERWRDPSGWPALVALTRLLDTQDPPVGPPASATALARLARAAAVLAPKAARRLADRAFQLASPTARQSLPLAGIDLWVAASLSLGSGAAAARRGLAAAERGLAGATEGPRAAEVDALVDALAAELKGGADEGSDAEPLLACLRAEAPELVSRARRQAGVSARSLRAEHRDDARKRAEPSLAAQITRMVLLLIAVSGLVRRCGRTSGIDSTSPPAPSLRGVGSEAYPPLSPAERDELKALQAKGNTLTTTELRRRTHLEIRQRLGAR